MIHAVSNNTPLLIKYDHTEVFTEIQTSILSENWYTRDSILKITLPYTEKNQ